MKPPFVTANLLLEALPPQSRNRLQHLLTPVSLRRGVTIHEPGSRVTEVVFPTTCMVSVVTRMVNGETVESATVGNEGMCGLPVFLSAGATVEAFVQIPGDALRMDARQLLLIAEEDAAELRSAAREALTRAGRVYGHLHPVHVAVERVQSGPFAERALCAVAPDGQQPQRG